ncbi:hypothetical protein IKD57_02295 [Candidatus Saccharibacteria bacterium]|nr:hypothetical protein [Candidatus Saccharibacteria bacterium]
MDKSGSKAGGAPGSTGSAKNSMTPGFRGGAGGGEKTAGLSASGASARNEKGAATLGAGEAVAAGAVSSDFDTSEDLLDETREGEENAEGYYSGNGGEDGEDEKGNFFKNKLIPTSIIGIVLAVFGFFAGLMMNPTFGLIEQIRTEFNTMQTSVRMRSTSMARYQLDNDFVTNPTRAKLFGPDKFVISQKQREKLNKQNIEVIDDTDANGKKITYMRFEEDGKTKIIVADERLVGEFSGKYGDAQVESFRQAFEGDTKFFEAYKTASMTWRGAIANWFSSTADEFLSTNKLTRNIWKKYKEDVEEANGNARAAMSDTMARGAEDLQEPDAKVAKTKADDVDENGNPKIGSKVGVEVEGGNEAVTARPTYKRSEMSMDSISEKLKSIGKKMGGDSGGGVSGVVQTAVSSVCLVSDTIGAIAIIVSASQALQIIQLITGMLEAGDKARAGDGDDSPINEQNNVLVQPTTNYHYEMEVPSDVEAVDSGAVDLEAEKNGSTKTIATMTENARKMESNNTVEKLDSRATQTTKSAMDANAVIAMFNGGKVDANDPSVQSLNATGNGIKKIVVGLGVGMVAFNTCAGAKMVANMWGVGEGIASSAACIAGILGTVFSYGGSLAACGPLVAKIISGVAMSAVIGTLISVVVGAIVPLAAKMMTRNLIAELGGEDLGNAYASGGNMYLGGMHRSNGGSLANKEKFLQFALGQQATIAEDAKYDRITKSPFDISSPYTFFGSLSRQLMNYTSANSIMSAITSTNSVISSSIIGLSPTAYAVDISNKLVDNYDEVCPYLDSINAVGDAFCNPYVVTDVSTINDSPMDVVDKISDNLIIETVSGEVLGCSEGETDCSIDEKSDSGIKIKGDSDLAKWILYSDNRNSAFGIVDHNIAAELADWGNIKTPNSSINTVGNAAIGGVPVVGDLVDVVDNAQKLANYGYITGAASVAGNDLPPAGTETTVDFVDYEKNADGEVVGENVNSKISIATPDWDEAKYYQRFIEDQSLLETMGVIDESAVTAFLREYHEEHPLDNSYEGILARYSGMEKEDVIALLDIIDYGNYLADYNPSERYAFSQEVKPEGTDELKFDNDQKVAYVVLLNTIEFADVRNRNFVV